MTLIVDDMTYSPDRVESLFRLRQLFGSPQGWPFISRFCRITAFVVRFLFYVWWDEQVWTYLGEPDIERAQTLRRRQHARWLTQTLLTLGPTFIKVGQQFSSRVDLVRKEVIDELAKLQDQVPPFPVTQARQIIEQELGAPPETLFSWFDPNHLAAASLGQVHRATTLGGDDVIIKIQRPNLIGTFDLDLAIMRKLARYAENLLEMGKGRDWVAIVDEFGRTLFSEVDYIQEGRNADTFRQQFAHSTLRQKVHFPVIYWPLTGRRVITMEYAPGTKINDILTLNRQGLDLPDLAQTVLKLFFEQILVHGFYHADPHPGNLAVRDDGKIILYDYGMVGTIPAKTRKVVVDTFLNIVSKRPDALLANIIELDMLAPNADIDVIRELIVWAIDNYYDKPHDQLNFEQLTDELAELMYAHPFKLPANITFMVRALVTLEGVATTLHPQIKLMSAAVDYAQDFMGKTLDLPYLLRKAKDLIGLPDNRLQPTSSRVRLHNDEWVTLSRYVKAGFVLLGMGQFSLLLLVLVMLASQPRWQTVGNGWALPVMMLVLLLIGLLGIGVLLLLPSRKHRAEFNPGKLNKPT
jgi:predicted unusual protein kinase regulating ubiquinone biosynthesis (AarF/ABC1/UbiB family)